MGLAEALAQSSRRLVGRFGGPITVRRTTTTFDPQTGQTSTVDVDYQVTATLTEYHESVIDGERVRQGDRRVLISAADLGVEPKVGDLVFEGHGPGLTNPWRVSGPVRIRRVGGTPVTYELQVRR